MGKRYHPPFAITSVVLSLVGDIMRMVGRYEGIHQPVPQPTLRRHNQIRTVVGSLAIEGNTLTLEQVTAILGDQPVVGSNREILEVTNAIAVYEGSKTFVPTRERDLLRAHGQLMAGLQADAGTYRRGGVGVFKGAQLAHMAPPAARVPQLVAQLLEFLRLDATPAVIKSAVVHYELEFIHPFSDGNGRIGRLWQHVILQREHPVFEFVPLESVIHARQAIYYRVLGECDESGDSTSFIEFSLTAIRDSLEELLAELRPAPLTGTGRLELAAGAFGRAEFTRKEYLSHFKGIATATASRDLRQGVDDGRLVKLGDLARSRYRFR